MRCTLFLLNPVLQILLILFFNLLDANYSGQLIPTSHLVTAMIFMLANLLLWRKIMGLLWNVAHFSRKVIGKQVIVGKQMIKPHYRTQSVHCRVYRPPVPGKKLPKLITQSVYHPPVHHKKLPFALKQRCYMRSNYHCLKQSHCSISWRAKAKMTEYKCITPVWPSNKSPYPFEYSPSAAISVAISTLELLQTHIESKN